MSFTNPSVDPHTLPAAGQTSFEPLAPAYPWLALLRAGLHWLVLELVLLVVAGTGIAPSEVRAHVLTVATVVPAIAALALPLRWAEARRRGMAVRHHDLLHRWGLVWQHESVLAFSRIQHMELVQGPLERVFGLATLKCYTPGGHAADLSVEGLTAGWAARLRAHILEGAAPP